MSGKVAVHQDEGERQAICFVARLMQLGSSSEPTARARRRGKLGEALDLLRG